MAIVLIVLTVAGAIFSGAWESREYAMQRSLNHGVLTAVRIGVGLLLIRIVGLMHEPGWIHTAMHLVMMAGVFGPVHRLSLNLYRMFKYRPQNKNTQWFSLSMRGYDLLLVWITSERWRFVTLCGTELLIAAAMYAQLT